MQRKAFLEKAKRIVVKAGSAVLTNELGVDQSIIDHLAQEISLLKERGKEVLLVSSGAVAAGKKKLGYRQQTPLSIKQKQAFAAIGQSLLMHDYDDAFAQHDTVVAQVLLTHSDLAHRGRYLNVRNTLLSLIQSEVIPIINENDTVSTEELKFSDNDTLAALVANLIEADMLVCLTDVDALYDKDPKNTADARPIHTVDEINEDILALAGKTTSSLGTGGMASKINAARIVASGGGCSFIGSGKQENILQDLFSGKLIGTFFLPHKERMQKRKHWIAEVLTPKGDLVLDPGACRAIQKNGRSLLPSGIVSIEGDFNEGDCVRCRNLAGQVIAVGLINHDQARTSLIKGCKTSEVEEKFGYKGCEEVIHRDNMVIL